MQIQECNRIQETVLVIAGGYAAIPDRSKSEISVSNDHHAGRPPVSSL
jgi:hypothetical protein